MVLAQKHVAWWLEQWGVRWRWIYIHLFLFCNSFIHPTWLWSNTIIRWICLQDVCPWQSTRSNRLNAQPTVGSSWVYLIWFDNSRGGMHWRTNVKNMCVMEQVRAEQVTQLR